MVNGATPTTAKIRAFYQGVYYEETGLFRKADELAFDSSDFSTYIDPSFRSLVE